MSLSPATCSLGIFSCIAFYSLSKVLICASTALHLPCVFRSSGVLTVGSWPLPGRPVPDREGAHRQQHVQAATPVVAVPRLPSLLDAVHRDPRPDDRRCVGSPLPGLHRATSGLTHPCSRPRATGRVADIDSNNRACHIGLERFACVAARSLSRRSPPRLGAASSKTDTRTPVRLPPSLLQLALAPRLRPIPQRLPNVAVRLADPHLVVQEPQDPARGHPDDAQRPGRADDVDGQHPHPDAHERPPARLGLRASQGRCPRSTPSPADPFCPPACRPGCS